jgi:unsaturated rhamnogalacturonyl hydrolase
MTRRRRTAAAVSSIVLALAVALAPGAAAGADRWTVGLTVNGSAIDALAVPGAAATSPTVLLVGGLQGNDQTSDAVARAVAAFEARPQGQRQFRLLAIPVANPDARPLQFPPPGVAYRDNVESHVLWRWIGTHAPDLVLIAAPERAPGAALADALSSSVVAEIGRIPARRVDPSATMLDALTAPIAKSGAREELERRAARTPRAFAEQLARVYGQEFAQPNYIAAMALISRLRLGQQADVAPLIAPYLDGTRDSFARPSQSSLAAHLLFAEWARPGRPEGRPLPKNAAQALVLRAASSAFTESGELREFMPLHGGWSDSLFMDVPILATAGALSGDRRYFDMAARHVAFMQRIVLRPDALYRHQASADAAWGRGNAFAALGMALTLSEFPVDHAAHASLLASFQQHMAALAAFQDENGMWRNVVDRPGAYAEYSATAMIGTAMLRGIRRGWLDGSRYQPLVDRAWQAIVTRTSVEGHVIDAAESTGTRGLTDADYLRRAAILGRDERSGGMAMYFATELAGL